MTVDLVVDIGTPSTPDPASGCATTLRDVVNQTRRLLLTGAREQKNRLTNAISAGATSLDIDFAAGSIVDGARLAIDLELFHVWSDPTGSTVEVDGAQDGSAAADHDAGSYIYVNPQYSDFEIVNAVNDVLRDLSSPDCGLFRVLPVDLTWDPNVYGYDLTDAVNVADLLDVYYENPSNQNRWVRVPNRQWRFQRNADTTAFPSGFGITFLGRVAAGSGTTIRVNYKTHYDLLADYTDNVETVSGLHCEAHDLLWVGAAIRLSESREIERNSTYVQGSPRRATEVPAGAQQQSPSGLRERWRLRVRSEAARLARDWPVYLR